ncbi:MAG TPA: ribonuclease III [Oligoflexia bacterium]|nr:ribonuclease III [Oligoflexia bacterium]
MQSIEQLLQHHFRNPKLLEVALIHKSFGNENRAELATSDRDNEQMEFLGDAVLDLAISELLLELFPQLPEGELSKLRASLVNEHTLAQVARSLQLGDHVKLGRGEDLTKGREKDSILSGTLEAVLAAIYRDAGYDVAKTWAHERFRAHAAQAGADERDGLHLQDHKTRFQEVAQALYKTAPRYTVTSATGPDHEKTFVIEVSIHNILLAEGTGRSKKEAEQQAAKNAFDRFGPKLGHPDLKKK